MIEWSERSHKDFECFVMGQSTVDYYILDRHTLEKE